MFKLSVSFFFRTLGFLVLTVSWIQADTVQWTGNGDSNWNNSGNWTGGNEQPPVNDLVTSVALFDSTSYANQPNAGVISIAGIQIGDGSTVTSELTISGTDLSIGSQGITVASNSGSLTLNAPVIFGASQNWLNNSASLATINGGVSSSGSFTLTVGGTGTGGTNFTGVISDGTGMTSLTIAGGSVSLSNYNTYSGGTTVSGGTLQLNDGGSAGTIQGSLTINSGGAVQLNAFDALGFNGGQLVTVANINGGTLNDNTSGNEGYSTSYNLTGGLISSTGGGNFNLTTGSGITSNASSTTSLISAGLTIRNGNNLVFNVAQGSTASGIDLNDSGVITENGGAGSITKSGSGTMLFSGTNNYSGSTTINSGTIMLGSSLALPVNTLNGGGNLVIGMGATLDLNSYSISLGNTSSGTGGTITNNNTANTVATLTFSNPSGALNQTLTDSNATTAGTGELALALTGGALTINSANTYSGGTTISGGQLNSNNASRVTSTLGTGTVTLSGTGTLHLFGNVVGTYQNNFVLNGGTLFSEDGDTHIGTATSTIDVTGSTTIERVWGHGSTVKNLNFDGILQGSSALTLNDLNFGFSEGGGLVIGNNANTYSGIITVNSTSGNGMALIDGGSTTLQFATVDVEGNGTGDVPYGLRFEPGNTTPTIGALQGNGNILLQDLAGTPAPVALSVGGSNTNTTYSGVLSGPGSVTKVGTGTMTLSGANTYTGSTTVNSGTLAVTGSLQTSQLTVTGGSLLFGSTNPVPSTTSLNLGGGRVGITSGGSSTTLGSLTLTGGTTSILDFGAGSAGEVLSFTLLAGLRSTTILDIYDYNNSSGANQDHLVLSGGAGTEGGFLSQINFYSDTGSSFLGTGQEVVFGGGGVEITPTAAPEYSTLLMGISFLSLLTAQKLRPLRLHSTLS